MLNEIFLKSSVESLAFADSRKFEATKWTKSKLNLSPKLSGKKEESEKTFISIQFSPLNRITFGQHGNNRIANDSINQLLC